MLHAAIQSAKLHKAGPCSDPHSFSSGLLTELLLHPCRAMAWAAMQAKLLQKNWQAVQGRWLLASQKELTQAMKQPAMPLTRQQGQQSLLQQGVPQDWPYMAQPMWLGKQSSEDQVYHRHLPTQMDMRGLQASPLLSACTLALQRWLAH